MAVKTPRPAARRSSPVSDQLRHVIAGRGLSPHAVASAAGVAPSALSRFVRGERGLTLQSVDAVAEVLGLRLVEVRGHGRAVPQSRKPAAARADK